FPLVVEPGGDFRVAVEEGTQVAGVEIRTAFNERSGAQQKQQIFIGHGPLPVNPAEVDVLNPPRHHMVTLSVHLFLTPKSVSTPGACLEALAFARPLSFRYSALN